MRETGLLDQRTRALDRPPRRVLAAIDDAARQWGARWQVDNGGGALALPVVQGLRRGVIHGRIGVAPLAAGTSLQFDIDGGELRLNRAAVSVLVLGALGGSSVVLWPLSPRILELAPVGAVLAIVAWLMVVSRLRNSGVDEFLDLIVELAESSDRSQDTG